MIDARPKLPIWSYEERLRVAVGALVRKCRALPPADALTLGPVRTIEASGLGFALGFGWGIDSGRVLAEATIDWESGGLDAELLWPLHDGPALPAGSGAWQRLGGRSETQWRACFDAERRRVNLRGACPACGAIALHRYFGDDGGKWPARKLVGWEWCRACRVYQHTKGRPEWWSAPGPHWASSEQTPAGLEAFLRSEGLLQPGDLAVGEDYQAGLRAPLLSEAAAADPQCRWATYWSAREALRGALASNGVTPDASGLTEVEEQRRGDLIVTEIHQYTAEPMPPRALARATVDTSRSVEPTIEILIPGRLDQ